MHSPRKRTIYLTVGALAVVGVIAAAQRRARPAPEQIAVPRAAQTHLYDLDDAAYPRFPLPASEQAYGDLNGDRMKVSVNEITAVSRKSRDDGNRFWGRIAGTQYDQMVEKWAEDKFKQVGLKDVRYQWFDLPPQWFPTDWSLTATGSGKTVALSTLRPVISSKPTSGKITVDAVWVGLGTAADFMGRDVRGKAVFIHSTPTPGVINNSAGWNGALQRAEERGAAVIVFNIAVPGNFTNQAFAGRVQNGSIVPGDVPTFTIGTEDATAVRELIEQGQPVKVSVELKTEMRSGLRDANVWGTLPGTTDEDVIIMAHHDAYFEGALDNASGMAVMVGLAEHFAKIPQSGRRRTMKFVTTSGHHAGSLGVKWMHDNRATFLAKTALIINCEHVSETQTYPWGPALRMSTNVDARRWSVNGSDKLAAVALSAYRLFGVTIYHEMEGACCGDGSQVQKDAPVVQLIESPVFYHSDHDRPDIVPAAGLESVSRAYAKIVDEVNKLERSDLQAQSVTVSQP
jgi:hypothetical protein